MDTNDQPKLTVKLRTISLSARSEHVRSRPKEIESKGDTKNTTPVRWKIPMA